MKTNASNLSSHPSINERLNIINLERIHNFSPTIKFKGFDGDGNLVAIFDIIAMKQFRFKIKTTMRNRNECDYYKTILFAQLKTTGNLTKPCELKDFKLKGIIGEFDNKEDTWVYPSSNTGLMFVHTSKEKQNILTSTDLKLSIRNVSYWKRES